MEAAMEIPVATSISGEIERVLRAVNASSSSTDVSPLEKLRELNDLLEKRQQDQPKGVPSVNSLTPEELVQLEGFNDEFKREYSQRKQRLITQFHSLLETLLGSDLVPLEVAQAVKNQASVWSPNVAFTIDQALALTPSDLKSILDPSTRPPSQTLFPNITTTPPNVDIRSIVINASRADLNRPEKKPIGKGNDKPMGKGKEGDLDEDVEEEEHEDRPAKPPKPERVKPKKEMSKSQMKKLGLKPSPTLAAKTSSSPLPTDPKLVSDPGNDIPQIGESLSRTQKKQLKAEKKAQRRAAKQVSQGRSLGPRDGLTGNRDDGDHDDDDEASPQDEDGIEAQHEDEGKGKTEEEASHSRAGEEPSGYEEDEETGVESVPYQSSF